MSARKRVSRRQKRRGDAEGIERIRDLRHGRIRVPLMFSLGKLPQRGPGGAAVAKAFRP